MQFGRLISGYMSRQMEFDADRYATCISGSKIFSETSHQLSLLSVGNNSALDTLYSSWEDGHLADDLPKLIKSQADQIPVEYIAEIKKQSLERKTGFMDTHPCDSERIKNANKENTEGIFQLEIPAKDLFKEYSKFSKISDTHCLVVLFDSM